VQPALKQLMPSTVIDCKSSNVFLSVFYLCLCVCVCVNDQSNLTDSHSCHEDKTTSEFNEASTQSCGDENKYVPVAVTSASTDEDINGQPQQSAVPGNSASVIVESNPRDIVARIYREELLKLAEAARVNGNLAEFVMYERELERLNQTTGHLLSLRGQHDTVTGNRRIAIGKPITVLAPPLFRERHPFQNRHLPALIIQRT
jgi:hypothetical protein